ncbi:MAG: protease modulator HflC [Alphaproteobacteria bacterium]|jgi:membrane protease subunit HflC|nr:MAG: protease modulator HflC [Alphaproteobacteria bacterium]
MNRRLLAIIGVVLVVAGILAMSSFFTVDQTEQALVLQFGQPRRVIREPGLWVKRPFVENVILYDTRVLDFEPPHEEVIVSDQKRLVADTYTRYRIVNPLQFYQTVGSEAGVRARLSALVSGSLRRVLGSVTLNDVLSNKRAAIMVQIRDDVAVQAKDFGIDVVDVRLRRADLPEENSQAIYARMQSEREQQARQYRGEGAEAAQNVRANAERERTVILAEAQRDAQRVRGDGDGQSIKIYADAFGQDKEFFAFYRSLQAYRDALNGKDTSFILSPEGNFFRFFGGWTGEAATAGAPHGTPPRAANPATGGAGAGAPPR